MIVITTPTGHIGSKLLSELVRTDEKLRVIARDPSKLSEGVRDKIEIVKGSLDDPETVSNAYEGAEQLFFIVPPSIDYADADEYYLRFGKATCDAIRQNGVKRVVYVSGTGLGHEKNAGAVSASFLVEELLKSTEAATRILHCGTFMENLLHSVQPIKFTGEYGTPVPSDTKLPWVATRDIADAAASLLLDKAWTGKGSVGVLGPEDLSYGEITAITIQDALAAVPNGVPFVTKIDIEGFESDLFASNLDWIDDMVMVLIEPHDWMVPGQFSSHSFQQAMGARRFELFINGENLIYVAA